MGRGAHGLAFVLALAGAGCFASESTAAPDVAQARSAVDAATRAGGRDDLEASVYLALADKEIGAAEARLLARDQAGATRWAARAHADAEVALMVARALTARGAAQRTLDAASQLADELVAPPAAGGR